MIAPIGFEMKFGVGREGGLSSSVDTFEKELALTFCSVEISLAADKLASMSNSISRGEYCSSAPRPVVIACR